MYHPAALVERETRICQAGTARTPKASLYDWFMTGWSLGRHRVHNFALITAAALL
jgi:hypothetical protein